MMTGECSVIPKLDRICGIHGVAMSKAIIISLEMAMG